MFKTTRLNKQELLVKLIICYINKMKNQNSQVNDVLITKRSDARVWSQTLRRAIRAKYTSNICSVWPQLRQIVLRDFYQEK